MFRGFSLLVLTVAAGAAHAAGEPGFDAKDPAALYDNLQSMGYAPDPIDAKSDPPSTVITASGSRYWVVTGGCTAGRDCRYIVVGASFNDVVDPPADWLAFREKIQKSDAVLFVTPEYNRSIPGVLKNAIDVGSRPSGQSSFKTKPIGIVANSPGPLGGMAAAMNLKQSLPGFCGPILQQPEIYLNGVGDAFDDKGNLVKESLQKVLQQYIDAFAAHVARHKA